MAPYREAHPAVTRERDRALASGRDLFDAALRLARRGAAPARPSPLERLFLPSEDRFAALRRRAVPLLLDGLAAECTGRIDWSLDHLKDRFGDRTVSTIPTDDGRLRSDARSGVQFETVRLGDYLDRLACGQRPASYLAAPGEMWLPELVAELQRPVYCRNAPWHNTRLWISPPSTSAPLHRDVAENFFFQLVGRKRFYLYAPAATPWLYSHAFRSALPNYSRFDPERPDYVRFPLSQRVEPLEVVLEPGDALYLPSRWWHQTRSLDVSVSFNFWWADGLLAAVVLAAERIKAARRLEIYGLANLRRARA